MCSLQEKPQPKSRGNFRGTVRFRGATSETVKFEHMSHTEEQPKQVKHLACQNVSQVQGCSWHHYCNIEKLENNLNVWQQETS